MSKRATSDLARRRLPLPAPPCTGPKKPHHRHQHYHDRQHPFPVKADSQSDHDERRNKEFGSVADKEIPPESTEGNDGAHDDVAGGRGAHSAASLAGVPL